jgi:O-antigen/teichoic acid export membrane protein
MSIEEKAFKGASWLALFKFISQIFSWIITVLVARILSPGDYGLMEMSTIITGYAAIFNELGLGAAIIQRPSTNQEELSSVFWFALGFSLCLALFSFAVSYPTAYIFHEPRVVPVTQTVSVLFIITGLQVVPFSLMQKELEFKKTGFIEMIGVLVSSFAMYIIASLGGGVWTLIGGHIIRELTKLFMVYSMVRWLPSMHFSFTQARNYLGFGITVAFGQSLFYVYDKSDKFFAGRVWSALTLGYYSFALQLAKIPTEKIVVLINQVSYPVFAKHQNDRQQFNRLYLNIIKITATLVLPVFVGGFMVGEDIIQILLNPKWYPMIAIFKYLCLTQIITSLNAVNNFVHTAQGRPQWSLFFNMIMAVCMPLSFFFVVSYGLNAIIIPWFTTYFIICIIWVMITINKLGITMMAYLKNLLSPFIGTLLMSIALIMIESIWYVPEKGSLSNIVRLMLEMLAGGCTYFAYLWFFEHGIFKVLKRLKNVSE